MKSEIRKAEMSNSGKLERVFRSVRKLVPGLCVFLAGCGGTSFDDRALDYGRTLSDASNRQIILNVLRAAAREPLFFSLVSNVDSRALGDVDVNIDTPLRITSTALNIFASASIEDPTPRFSVSSLMKANFMRSLSRPVDLGILERLLARDFEDELVMRLLVGDIGWQSEPLRNRADTFEKSDFRRRLRLLMAFGLSTEPLLGDNTLIEDLEQDDVLDLMEELGVATPRLSIIPDRKTGKFDLIGEPGGFRMCFLRPPVLSLDGLSDAEIARAVDLTCRIWVVSQLSRADLGGRDLKRLDREQKVSLLRATEDQLRRNADHVASLDRNERVDGDTAELEDLVSSLLSQSEGGEEDGVGEQELGRLEHFGSLALTIRSPVEVFDYLGALTRRDALSGDSLDERKILPNAAYDPREGCADRSEASTCTPLDFFRLRRVSAVTKGAVRFGASHYTVFNALDAPNDRTIETVAVLSELLALFIDSDDIEEAARVTILP